MKKNVLAIAAVVFTMILGSCAEEEINLTGFTDAELNQTTDPDRDLDEDKPGT